MSTTEPRITINKEARKITADFLLFTDQEGMHGVERRHYATFSVRYDKGGINYFNYETTPRSYTSSISRETEEDAVLADGRRIGTTRSFMLGQGLGLKRSETVTRYSFKRLQEFFDEALAHLDEIRDDPRVAKFFAATEAVKA